jgi:brefeldin A-resistance guanine nucleotide exchange factor 1
MTRDVDAPPNRSFDPARFATIVKHEARAVVASMRAHQRWSGRSSASSALNAYGLYGASDAYDEDGVEDALLDAFVALRTARPPERTQDADAGTRARGRDRASASDASEQSEERDAEEDDAMTPLRYLEPFLDVIRSVETGGMITAQALSAILKILKSEVATRDAPGGPGVIMHAIADAVTLCRFEATSVDDDDAVLSQIMYVLAACVRCDCGYALSDDDLCDVFQACYRIGHQSGKETPLLRELSKQTLSEIVYHVSRRTGEIAAKAKATTGEKGPRLTSPRQAIVIPATPPAVVRGDAGVDSPHATGPGMDVTAHEHTDVAKGPYGLPALIEIFRFATSLIAPDTHGRGSEDANSLFGLKLVTIMIDANAEYFRANHALLNLVLDDLSRALCGVVTSCSPHVLAASTSLITIIYSEFREELKLHLEVFVRMVLLPLCSSRNGVEEETQRVALEALVDLCKNDNFATDLYMYYDCELTKPNVFEEVTSVLAQASYPGDATLAPVHLLSLEGLLSIVQAVSNRSPAATTRPTFEFANTVVMDPWSLSDGSDTTGPSRFEARARTKYFKRRLLSAAEHFNRSYKKGLAFMQEIKLLADPLEPAAVARFLKFAPALDKEVVGDYLGEPAAFIITVLDEYTKLFDFRDVTLDRALRSFLSGFKLPGEAQKISRILECFAARYYEANPDSVADADSAYVLSYSIIMLNTDQHNAQVKNKMTLEQFIRNNRGTNGGNDWPAEVLVNIFDSIVTDEIKLDDGGAMSLTPSRWAELSRDVGAGQGKLPPTPNLAEAALYDGELFGIVWGSTTAAIAAVFEHTADDKVLQSSLGGFLSVANIAAAHGMSEVLDQLVATLCKFSNESLAKDAMSPSGERLRPLVVFGEDIKACAATRTIFGIAHKYGDTLRQGWCNILDTVLRMTKVGLVPEDIFVSGSDFTHRSEMQTMRVREIAAAKRNQGSSLLRSFSAMISGDDGRDSPLPPPSEAEQSIEELATACATACRVKELFADTKFLELESLTHLMRALIWAAGDPGLVAATADDEDAALFCLDAMFMVTLRNCDRIRAVLPILLSYLRAVLQASESPSPACEIVIFDLIRMCAKLIPTDEDVADDLLDALPVLFTLKPAVADAFFGRIVAEIDSLISNGADKIKTRQSWDTVCKLLMASARHAEAAETGFAGLTRIMREAAKVNAANVRSCLEAASAFVDSEQGGDERSVAALQLLSDANMAMCAWATSASVTDEAKAEIIAGAWGDLVRELGRISFEDTRAMVRDDAILTLQRVLLGAESLDAGGDLWLTTFDAVLLTMLQELTETVRKTRAKDGGAAENTARIAVSCVSKTLLQYGSKMRNEDAAAFSSVLLAILDATSLLRKHAKTEELVDAIPEAIKNVLLVLCASEIVPRDDPLWGKMWGKASAIDSELTPDALGLLKETEESPP